MTILFKTTITEDKAFSKIEEALNTGQEYDGYFSIADDDGETPLPWGPSMSGEEFLAKVREMLELTWKAARFWVVYDRREDRGDPDAIVMRNAAFRISRGYNGVIVASLSLLGRKDAEQDLELIFVCFREDFQRRNFRIRFENKPVKSQ
ncbi:hypothetical protein [Agrobacterium bohemicum]|uniref:Uncharacterized protein n=1 Tax=Agrobacterium bohemicum TaxID=2052828 RepID=A0A135NYI4_9HYPH|nr:hypothetical protein [Agrobacterium bohemicum]KXG84230.1 hypothetical protein ATO67_14685 [Agrobacterium bohemicum]